MEQSRPVCYQNYKFNLKNKLTKPRDGQNFTNKLVIHNIWWKTTPWVSKYQNW